MENHAFSRRTFLKMAAGTAVGAALFFDAGFVLSQRGREDVIETGLDARSVRPDSV